MVDATSFSSSYSFFNGFFNLPDTWNYDFFKNLDYFILFCFSMLNKRLLSYNDVVIGPSAARAQNHTAIATR